MGLFTPDYMFRDITRITPQFLREKGIKALVLDVDNTLTEHGSQDLRPDIAAWLDNMRQEGFLLAIVSNNHEKRVAPFAQKLGLSYTSFSCKPLPRGIATMRNRWKLPKHEIALVGDQVYTDALAAGLYGITMLMVRPLAEDTKPTIRFKRALEKPILLRYYKKGGELL